MNFQQVRGMAKRKYARKYLRIRPESPINAEITTVRVDRGMAGTGTADARVMDICPGGLRFASALDLSVNSPVYLEMHLQVADMSFRLKGRITHKNGAGTGEYEYGFCFLEPDDALRICLKRLIKNMYVRLERRMVIFRFN